MISISCLSYVFYDEECWYEFLTLSLLRSDLNTNVEYIFDKVFYLGNNNYFLCCLIENYRKLLVNITSNRNFQVIPYHMTNASAHVMFIRTLHILFSVIVYSY